MSTLFSANRIAAISTFVAGLAAFVVGIASVPQLSQWQDTALAIAGVLTSLLTALKFLDGSQKWDALTVGQGNPPVNVDYDGPLANPPEGEYDPESLPNHPEKA